MKTVDDLIISTRLRNKLINAGYYFICELQNTTPDELLTTYEFGKRSYAELKAALPDDFNFRDPLTPRSDAVRMPIPFDVIEKKYDELEATDKKYKEFKLKSKIYAEQRNIASRKRNEIFVFLSQANRRLINSIITDLKANNIDFIDRGSCVYIPYTKEIEDQLKSLRLTNYKIWVGCGPVWKDIKYIELFIHPKLSED